VRGILKDDSEIDEEIRAIVEAERLKAFLPSNLAGADAEDLAQETIVVAGRRLFDIAHPTTRRLYRSTMTKRYKHPSPVAI
jgi:DNA-directed RNA polymerase specialized sigma24 family protein